MEINVQSIESCKKKSISNECSVIFDGIVQDFIFFSTTQTGIEEYLQSAWKNVRYSSEVLGIPLKIRGTINIIFMDIDEFVGLYYFHTEEIIIKKSLEDSDLESTIFHELLHYYYFLYFQNEHCGEYLSEGLATYFERLFYPCLKDELWLLKDRLTRDYPLYSFGYYLFCNYYSDLQSALFSGKVGKYMEENFNMISEIELESLLKHLAENLICIAYSGERDMKSIPGILFSWEIKEPYLVDLNQKNVERIMEYNNHLEILHIDEPLITKGEQELNLYKAEKSDWEAIANLFAQCKNSLKNEYKFYADTPDIHQLATT